jgi:hypothetical protein
MPDGSAGMGKSGSKEALVSQGANAPHNLRQSLSIAGLKVAGPSGFCPLPQTHQRLAEADFVAFAPCSGDEGAILAATIGAEASAKGLTLKRSVMAPYFATKQGQTALRGAGSSDVISVHEVADYKAAVILRLTREADGEAVNSWRALMEVEGRLVTLTVRPRQGLEIAGRDGHRLVTRFVDAIRGANHR